MEYFSIRHLEHLNGVSLAGQLSHNAGQMYCRIHGILQYFPPSLSYHLSFKYLFCLFLSGHSTQVLLYGLFLLVVFQYESDTAKRMKQMLIALGFPKPPTNINCFQLFSKVEAKVSVKGYLLTLCMLGNFSCL